MRDFDAAAWRPFFVTAAKGTEDLLAAELRELGAGKVRQDRGGVRFFADLPTALKVCLWTRIGMRVLMPLAELEVQGAEGLYEATRQIDWETYLTASTTFAVEANLRQSEHAHSGFVALKIKDALVDRLRAKLGARPDVDTRQPQARIVAHLARTKLSLSLDWCGDALFRRGYRAATTLAPLKPTLAAAMLRAAQFDGEEPFLDPLCGGGTIVIEAAAIAARQAPGLHRGFAIEALPFTGGRAATMMNELRREARAARRPPPAPILALDKSSQAITLARQNFAAARLPQADGDGAIGWRVGDATAPLGLSHLPPGLVVTNPPYGERSGRESSATALKTFYHRLSDRLAELEGWRIFVLAGHRAFESAFHRRPASRRELWNGPIRCALLGYEGKKGSGVQGS